METENNSYDFDLDDLLKNYYRHKITAFADPCPPAHDWLDYIDGHVCAEKIRPLQEHLPFCDECHAVVLSFKLSADASALGTVAGGACPVPWESVYQGLRDDSLQETRPTVPPASERWWQRLWQWIRTITPSHRYVWLSAGVALTAVLVLSGLLLRLYPSELSRLAYIKPATADSYTRSAKAVEDDRFGQYYARGLGALVEAQFWIFDRTDRAKVEEGIRALETAKQLASENQNQTCLADCYFQLSKAYLKKKDLVKAREQLAAIGSLSGSSALVLQRQREARDLLSELDRLPQDSK